jgi:hypothetical protein
MTTGLQKHLGSLSDQRFGLSDQVGGQCFVLRNHGVDASCPVQPRQFRQVWDVNVPTGRHEVRVRIQSPSDPYDETMTMSDATIGTNDSILRVVCGKKSGRLELKLE